MIVLGIDPGLATTGYGVIETKNANHMHLVDYGTILTPAGMKMPERLDIIYESMLELMDRFQPDSVAFEELFFSKNITTGIAVAHARGVLVTAAYQRLKGEIFEYTPMEVKQAVVGYGKADKRQVQLMVKTILGLREIPKPDDAADAVAIAITHAQSRAFETAFKY